MRDMKEPIEDRLVRRQELAELFNVKPATIDLWVREGTMPQPYKLGHRTLRWRLSEVYAWLESTRKPEVPSGR